MATHLERAKNALSMGRKFTCGVEPHEALKQHVLDLTKTSNYVYEGKEIAQNWHMPPSNSGAVLFLHAGAERNQLTRLADPRAKVKTYLRDAKKIHSVPEGQAYFRGEYNSGEPTLIVAAANTRLENLEDHHQ